MLCVCHKRNWKFSVPHPPILVEYQVGKNSTNCIRVTVPLVLAARKVAMDPQQPYSASFQERVQKIYPYITQAGYAIKCFSTWENDELENY